MFEISADWHKNAKLCTHKQKFLLACILLNITFEWLVISLTSENSKILYLQNDNNPQKMYLQIIVTLRYLSCWRCHIDKYMYTYMYMYMYVYVYMYVYMYVQLFF